jgi:succinate-semialdehyde dehydrogenase / glutarate-semialdehyde dehydrogenase
VAVERPTGPERVNHASVHRLRARARVVHGGAEPDAAVGPITVPEQLEVVRRHIADALERGARALPEGRAGVGAPFLDPVVLVDVPDEALILTEETFGPTLPVVKVRDADEAVAKANANPYGLGAAVFAKRRGDELASRLRAGACSVNTVMWFYAHRNLPFGGVGSSGFGVVHGPDGLRNFTHPKAVLRQRLSLGRYAFDRLDPHPRIRALMPRLARLLYGRR